MDDYTNHEKNGDAKLEWWSQLYYRSPDIRSIQNGLWFKLNLTTNKFINFAKFYKEKGV